MVRAEGDRYRELSLAVHFLDRVADVELCFPLVAPHTVSAPHIVYHMRKQTAGLTSICSTFDRISLFPPNSACDNVTLSEAIALSAMQFD